MATVVFEFIFALLRFIYLVSAIGFIALFTAISYGAAVLFCYKHPEARETREKTSILWIVVTFLMCSVPAVNTFCFIVCAVKHNCIRDEAVRKMEIKRGFDSAV